MAGTINKLVTFAELERMPDAPDGRYELRHGELVKVPPPKYGHYRIQHRLRRLLEALAHASGEVSTEFGFRVLPEYEYRIADVVFVSRRRSDNVPEDGYFEGAPDLVVEVLSPFNTAAEMLDREQLCLDNGAKEFWIVDPVRRQVRVSTAGGRAVTYKSGQEIPVFFGGSISVADIFSDN